MLMHESELLFGELHYEHRIVSFFDTLGWHDEIDQAGDDPHRIARLASVPRLFSDHVMAMAQRVPGALITAFSDNVVVSIPYAPDRLYWGLEGLATLQLGLGFRGFWIRGATTVGNLFHDTDIVFGPALNRAHELECRSAIYPRTIIDPLVPEFAEIQADFIDADESFRFTDPFSIEFIERMQKNPIDAAMISRYNEITGVSFPTAATNFDGSFLLTTTLKRIKAELLAAQKLRVWQKHAWLFDRIAPRLNLPERSSDFGPPPN